MIYDLAYVRAYNFYVGSPDLTDIWYLGRGRWVLLGSMPCDLQD